MENKTLKDFHNEGSLVPRHMIEENASFSNSIKHVENEILDKIKQEGIKLAKEMRRNGTKNFPINILSEEERGVFVFIKWFFDIKEEDLDAKGEVSEDE